MIKLEFLPKPKMIFRIGNLLLICCLICIEFGQALLMPYEGFVMLLKSRSHTHHPHMHYSYTIPTLGVGALIFSSRAT
jgi:hypothetical protein